MPSIYRAQIVIESTSAVPEDRIINNVHFSLTADRIGTIHTDITSALQTAWQNLASFWGATLPSSGHSIRYYNLGDTEPRVPDYVDALNIGTIDDTSLPRETAVCLSYRGVYESGVNPQRRRGRFYLGPFGLDAINGTTGRPSSTFITSAVALGQSLLDASDASSDYTWIVWSPTGQEATPVTQGWVDNEFDTVRSRGRVATARTTFS